MSLQFPINLWLLQRKRLKGLIKNIVCALLWYILVHLFFVVVGGGGCLFVFCICHSVEYFNLLADRYNLLSILSLKENTLSGKVRTSKQI